MMRNFVMHYFDDYQIVVLVPEVSISAKIEFKLLDTCYKLKQNYDMIYEPSYEKANKAFQLVYLESTLIDAYYQSKVSEYTMRRVAMEQATDNADDMLYELQLQYNR